MQQVLMVIILVLLSILVITGCVYYSKTDLGEINDCYEFAELNSSIGHTATAITTLSADHEANKQTDIISSTSTASTTAAVHLNTDHELSDHRGQSVGYILLYSIFEEQTGGAKNLWQLQVWAKHIGMSVVEPFASDSLFTMRGMAPRFSHAVRFGDYFDIAKWNDMVIKDGGSPLVRWDGFILNTRRKAIILHTVKQDYDSSLIVAYNDPKMCNTDREILHRDMIWIKLNFDIIRIVCYRCASNYSHPLSVGMFSSLVFGNLDVAPDQVTLIIVGWIGIQTTRINLQPIAPFTSAYKRGLNFPPSKKITAAFKRYIQRHIGDHKYVGIVFRTHHVMYFSPLTGSFAEQSRYLLQCSKQLGKVLDKVRGKWKIFLAYDMGRFGSKRYVGTNQLHPLQQQIFQDVFNGSLQVAERDESLLQATKGVSDKGVIAQLEKVIATNADCVILLGPHSKFVRSAGRLYSSLHQTNKCIVSICSEPVYVKNKLISSETIPDQFI